MSRFEDDIRAAIDRLVAVEFKTLGGSLDPEAARKLQRLVRDLEQELRVIRQAQVTIVIDRAHQGKPMSYQTPDQGRRFEMTWEQANRVHQLTPLRLHQVISEDAAEFVPAIGLEIDAATAALPMPPFALPTEPDIG
jgi:hypothetical protein